MEDCINCGMSLSGGDLTLPWEDDDNPNAYIICPHCRTKTLSMVMARMMTNPCRLDKQQPSAVID